MSVDVGAVDCSVTGTDAERVKPVFLLGVEQCRGVADSQTTEGINQGAVLVEVKGVQVDVAHIAIQPPETALTRRASY